MVAKDLNSKSQCFGKFQILRIKRKSQKGHESTAKV